MASPLLLQLDDTTLLRLPMTADAEASLELYSRLSSTMVSHLDPLQPLPLPQTNRHAASLVADWLTHHFQAGVELDQPGYADGFVATLTASAAAGGARWAVLLCEVLAAADLLGVEALVSLLVHAIATIIDGAPDTDALRLTFGISAAAWTQFVAHKSEERALFGRMAELQDGATAFSDALAKRRAFARVLLSGCGEGAAAACLHEQTVQSIIALVKPSVVVRTEAELLAALDKVAAEPPADRSTVVVDAQIELDSELKIRTSCTLISSRIVAEADSSLAGRAMSLLSQAATAPALVPSPRLVHKWNHNPLDPASLHAAAEPTPAVPTTIAALRSAAPLLSVEPEADQDSAEALEMVQVQLLGLGFAGSDSGFHGRYAIRVGGGARLDCQRCTLRGGALAEGGGTRLRLSDTLLAGSREHGVCVQDGASARVHRGTIERSRGCGVFVMGEGSAVETSDVRFVENVTYAVGARRGGRAVVAAATGSEAARVVSSSFGPTEWFREFNYSTIDVSRLGHAREHVRDMEEHVIRAPTQASA